MECVGAGSRVAPSDPRLYFLRRPRGRSAGVATNHIHGVTTSGESQVPFLARQYLERRCWGLQTQEKSFVHLGTEQPQDSDFSVALTLKVFADKSGRSPTAPATWADRQRLVSLQVTRDAQFKMGQ